MKRPTSTSFNITKIPPAVSFLVKAAVSGAFLYVALHRVNWVILSVNTRKMHLSWVIAAFFLFFIQILFGAMRWQRIAKVCALELTAWSAIRYSLIANFFNQGLPAAVGGDVIRIFLLGRKTGKTAETTYSVIIDRCLGGAACALLVITVLPWTFSFINGLMARIALSGSSFAILFIFIGLLLTGLLPKTFLRNSKLISHARALSSFVSRLFSPILLGEITAGSILIHLFGVFVVWCLAKAVSAELSIFAAIALVPAILLIAMIPISIAGWGIREAAAASILAYDGVPQSSGVLISVLYGVTLLALGILGGCIWAVDRNNTASAPQMSD